MAPADPPHLFSELRIRELVLKNRVGIAPMCTYSATDGVLDDWHLVHLGSRAMGGAGLVMTEATAVTPEGRITTGCAGLWNDAQEASYARVARFISECRAVPAIQLAHAGRKASKHLPKTGGAVLPLDEGGWTPLAPSSVGFDDTYLVPAELHATGIGRIIEAFRTSAIRAVDAGFRLVELHGAHGYLIHSFLSPLSNQRTDTYGGDLIGRSRFLREVVDAVRGALPDSVGLAVRLSATDWVEDGWSIEDTVWLSARLREQGVDLIDCSSGGSVPAARIPVAPGYQLPFASRVRRETGTPVAAVGMFLDPQQADAAVAQGDADLVLIGRESLRDPYWPYVAATELGYGEHLDIPHQYVLGWKRRRGGHRWVDRA